LSLVLTAALLAAGGALAAGATARWLAAVRKRRLAEAAPSAKEHPDALADAGFEIGLGEVISVERREHWIESAWLLREAEDAQAAILFAGDASLLARPKPRAELHALEAVELAGAAALPPTLHVADRRFERALRRPVEIEALGEAPVPPWPSALFAEYRAVDGALLFVLERSGMARGWHGRRLRSDDIERWGKS
jgi:hypothetical protein